MPPAELRRVLGIDPGTRHIGWGVIEAAGPRARHVAHGVLHLDPELSIADRLVGIDDALGALIEEHAPTAGAVESIFFSRDPQSAAKLGHARGVILLRLARAKLPIGEYAPALVKRSVVGKGAADKRQVALVVQAALGLAEPLASDAADALAVALTHLRVSGFDSLVAAAKAAAKAARR